MMSDDKDRDISGAGPEGRGGKKDRLEIEAENLNDDLSYEPSARTVNIEQELEKALAEDDGAEVTASDLNFNFPKAKKSGGGSRLILPAVVLVVFAGAAGFIAMHPEMLGRGEPAVSPAVIAAAPKSDPKIVLAQADLSETSPAAAQSDAAHAHDTAAAAAAAATIPPAPAAVPPAQPSMSAPLVAPSPSMAYNPAAPASAKPTGAGPAAASPAPVADQNVKLAQANVPAAPPALSAPEASSEASGSGKSGLADIASDMKNAPSAPPADAGPVPVADGQGPHPDQTRLQTPVGAPAASTPAAAGSSSAKGPAAKKAAKDSDAYYDADATVPSGQMAQAVGPRKVDPNKEPGQKLVVVSGVRKATDTESIIVSADRALKLGRYDAALDMYNGLYVKSSHDPRILMGRAVAQEKLGMTDSAIQSYDDLLQIQPGNADAMVNMLGLLKKKDPAEAMQRMLQLEGKYPNHPGLAAQIGIAEGEAGNYQEAMRYLGKAASLEPNNPQHPFNMAVLADRQGDTANAIKMYEQALTVDSANAGGAQTIPRESVYDRLAVLRRRS